MQLIASGFSHFVQELQGTLSLAALFACADRDAAADHIGLQAALPHFLQQLKGALLLHALLACTDPGTAADHIGLEAARPHFLQELNGALDPPPFSQFVALVALRVSIRPHL